MWWIYECCAQWSAVEWTNCPEDCLEHWKTERLPRRLMLPVNEQYELSTLVHGESWQDIHCKRPGSSRPRLKQFSRSSKTGKSKSGSSAGALLCMRISLRLEESEPEFKFEKRKSIDKSGHSWHSGERHFVWRAYQWGDAHCWGQAISRYKSIKNRFHIAIRDDLAGPEGDAQIIRGQQSRPNSMYSLLVRTCLNYYLRQTRLTVASP